MLITIVMMLVMMMAMMAMVIKIIMAAVTTWKNMLTFPLKLSVPSSLISICLFSKSHPAVTTAIIYNETIFN